MIPKVNIYEPCDKAIKAMNREALRDFGRLKLAKWDELHLIREVTAVYSQGTRRARKRYYEVAIEAYLLAMALCGEDPKKAHRMADSSVTLEMVDAVLTGVDPVTLYRFTTEAERKAQRLAETLEEAPDKGREIDKALRYWTRQLAQYAIAVTDAAVVKAYQDAGVERVMWVTERDERVCEECGPLDGRIFDIGSVPPKPHWGCRCRLVPVK